MTASTNIRFEDWEAEQMKDPKFQAAVEELEPACQAARQEYSKNERAGQLLGFRQKGQSILEPSELGYRCPVCKNLPIVNHEYDERLTWSEYNSFLWCGVCNRDFPSCLCLQDIERAIGIFLDSTEDAMRRNKSLKVTPNNSVTNLS